MSDIIAAYSGSFDPITLGHNDIMHRAAPRCTPKLIMRVREEPLSSTVMRTKWSGACS